MLTNFNDDLKEGREAELIALEVLKAYSDYWTLEDVAAVKECRYLGDIKATLPTGAVKYIEVKNDKRIADTKHILCEEENYIKDSNRFIKGNMSCNGDYYAIVS